MLLLIVVLIFISIVYVVKKYCKDKTMPVKLIYFEIIFNCVIKFLQGYIGLPSILNYVTDALLILIVIIYIYLKGSYVKKKYVVPKKITRVFVIYFLVTIISYISNIYNPLLFLWGFRNNMRFLIFSMMCVVFLSKDDLEKIIKILFVFYFLNILAITYEYFFAGLIFRTGDVISGLYSVKTTQGGNGELNWLLCIVTAITLINYLNNKNRLSFLILIILSAIYMAALSELKIYFVEMVLITLFSIALCKKSLKIIVITVIGIVILNIGINLLYMAFPKFKDYFSIDNLYNNITSQDSYNNNGGVSRADATAYVLNNYLKTISKKMFGIGFGNADYSSIDALTSNFYKQNYTSSYQWFYSSFIMVETGIAGLIAYINIIYSFIKEDILLKMKCKVDNAYINFSIIICCLSIFMLFYNQSLKIETAGYMVYLFLSIPYIMEKNLMEENEYDSIR